MRLLEVHRRLLGCVGECELASEYPMATRLLWARRQCRDQGGLGRFFMLLIRRLQTVPGFDSLAFLLRLCELEPPTTQH